MKKLLLYTFAAVALVGCSNENFPSEAVVVRGEEPVAINFGAASYSSYTRADQTGDAAANILNNLFHVNGVKTVDAAVHTVYPDYVVEYNGTDGAGAAGSTSTNTHGWEYVGLTSHPGQTLHYWDYSATNYIFQAWSPTVGNASVTPDGHDALNVVAPTVADLASLYVADLVNVEKSATAAANRFGGTVTFAFRNMSAKVRLGIYETVPGYSVSQLTFRSWDGRFTASSNHALLDGLFNAVDATAGVSYHVSYNPLTGRAELTNLTAATGATSLYYDFGTFTQDIIGTDSSNPTWAGGTPSYAHVLPNEDNAADMTLYVDFTLTAEDGSDDVIRVTGAHVTVPASYMVWHPNYAYTYLFKITKDVNGTTGEEGTDPDKLYPITFDAVVRETQEAATSPYETELKD